MAAAAPIPADVTTCLKCGSAASPAANTPGTLVRINISASMYPCESIFNCSSNSCVLGVWPMKMKTPSVSKMDCSPVWLFFSRTDFTLPVPRISVTTVFQMKLIFG